VKTIVELTREAGGFAPTPEFLERLVELARADERKNKQHSLGPGEMEISMRRAHNGELFELRHRFTAQQVIHGPDFLVEEVAKSMDAQMDYAIRARGETK
jgi:hypothetical protein